MDALIVLMEGCTELWFEQACSGNRTHGRINGIMVWAGMLW